MIEAQLHAHLAANVPSVGGRVFPEDRPQNALTPAITYALIGDPRDHTHDGPSGLVRARYQIDCFASEYREAKLIADAVRLALDGFKGAWGPFFVGLIFNDGGRDVRDPDDLKTRRQSTDYLIYYKEN